MCVEIDFFWCEVRVESILDKYVFFEVLSEVGYLEGC